MPYRIVMNVDFSGLTPTFPSWWAWPPGVTKRVRKFMLAECAVGLRTRATGRAGGQSPPARNDFTWRRIPSCEVMRVPHNYGSCVLGRLGEVTDGCEAPGLLADSGMEPIDRASVGARSRPGVDSCVPRESPCILLAMLF